MKKLGKNGKGAMGVKKVEGGEVGGREREWREGAHNIITAAPWSSIFSSVPRGKRAPAYTGQTGHLTACFSHLYLIKLVSICQPPLCSVGGGSEKGRQAGWMAASGKENGVPSALQITVR